MRKDNIYFKILKLDKSIYNELIVAPSSLQRAIAIWVATAFIASLSVFRIFENIISYIQTQLSIIASEIPQELLIEIGTAISELEAIFNSESSTTTLLTSVGTSLAVALIGVSFVFLLLKYLFRKEPNFYHIVIISGFASVPGLLNILVLFTDSLFLQLVLGVSTGILSLFCLGSGLKQVYLLRNIETILLVVGSSIVGSLLLPTS